MTTDDRTTVELWRRAVAQLEQDAIKPDADGYYDVEKLRAAFGVKQPIVFGSPPQTFENKIGFTAEEIERARCDPEAFLELVMRHDPRPSPPAGEADQEWARFCQRQETDTGKSPRDYLREAAESIAREEAAENDAIARAAAALGRSTEQTRQGFERLQSAIAAIPPVVLSASDQALIRRRRALEEAVSRLAFIVHPTLSELARMRLVIGAEARRLAETTGHTYESALDHISDSLRGVAVLRPAVLWEDLREHLERIVRDNLSRPAPALDLSVPAPGGMVPTRRKSARDSASPSPAPALPKRQQIRNKYAAGRPPGKR